MEEMLSACQACLDSPESIFANLNQTDKEQLLNFRIVKQYRKGDTIYHTGDRPGGILCLAQGKVKIFQEGVTGREQIIRLVKPVGFIGYRAFFAEENYKATAVAIEDSVVCQFLRENVLQIFQSQPDIMMKVLKSLANELGVSNKRTLNLTQKHIRGRLAESLIFLVNSFGFEDDKQTIKAYLSREDLANLSNMTTSNAIRTLSNFTAEGVLDVDGRRIRVLDQQRLNRISELG